MKRIFPFRALWALGILAASSATLAHAQDAAPVSNAPVESAPVGLRRETKRPRRAPEDRRMQLEARLREMMQSFGVSAPATQDAIVDYLAEEEAGRLSVREAARRLLNGLRRDAPPERMRDLISSYQTALTTDSKRREQAQTALDAKIGFSFDTQLEALLWLSGVLGEGGSALPIGTLAARVNAPKPSPAFDAPRASKRDARRGQLIGILENKASGWIEVRSADGTLERFWPTWNDKLAAFEPRVVAAISQLPLGARVRVEWERFERRRIVDLTPEPNRETRPGAPGERIEEAALVKARDDAR